MPHLDGGCLTLGNFCEICRQVHSCYDTCTVLCTAMHCYDICTVMHCYDICALLCTVMTYAAANSLFGRCRALLRRLARVALQRTLLALSCTKLLNPLWWCKLLQTVALYCITLSNENSFAPSCITHPNAHCCTRYTLMHTKLHNPLMHNVASCCTPSCSLLHQLHNPL